VKNLFRQELIWLIGEQCEELFEHHHFHKEVSTPSGTHLEYADNPILHPLATIDRGLRSVDCTTNLSSLEPKDVASLVKYAQMAITILRTYYNFCFDYKSNGTRETPAQRLGLTDKQFSLKDIINLR